jgi:3-oxoadipate enol-lactonase
MGGAIAQLLWQRHRHVVDGLVLCATAARFGTRSELNGPFGLVGYGMARALSGVPANIRRQGFSLLMRNRAAERGIEGWAVEEWERNDPAALLHAGLALARFDSRPWISTVDVPTSVVVTTLDVTVSPARQWHLAQLIPGARAFPIATDHRGCAERARIFMPVLLTACRAARHAGLIKTGSQAPAAT